MAGTERTRTVLEGWFESGDKPTQQQFYDFIASCLNLQDDTIITNRIQQVLKLTAKNTDFQAALTANKFLTYIIFKVTSGTPTIKVGKTNGASAIIWQHTISANTSFTVPDYFESSQTLWFAISGGVVDINIVYFDNFF